MTDTSTTAVSIPAVKILIAVALNCPPLSGPNGDRDLASEDRAAPADLELASRLSIQCFDVAQHQLAQSIFKNLQETFIIDRQQILSCALHSAML